MMLRLNGFAVAALLAGAIPALAQNNVAVTQGNPLRTPDTGSPEAHGKKMPVYHLEGFSLRGTTRVDTDAIVAALPQHAGDVITNAELREDADKVRQELKASHVHGNISTMILRREGPGHRVWVMWDIQPDDALSYLPMVGVRHFGSQSFFGNTKVSTAALVAATGLHAGDKMMDGRVGDARTGIEQAYDRALPGANVQVSAKVKLTKDNTVIIDWTIVEPHG